MATLRQFSEEFYCPEIVPRRSELTGLFKDLSTILEREITMRLFDANRTMTSLASEEVRTVIVDGVPKTVFERCLRPRMEGKACTITSLPKLLEVLPDHAIVRRHPKEDFCLVLPLMVSTDAISNEQLSAVSPIAPATPSFDCSKSELFVTIGSAPFLTTTSRSSVHTLALEDTSTGTTTRESTSRRLAFISLLRTTQRRRWSWWAFTKETWDARLSQTS